MSIYIFSYIIKVNNLVIIEMPIMIYRTLERRKLKLENLKLKNIFIAQNVCRQQNQNLTQFAIYIITWVVHFTTYQISTTLGFSFKPLAHSPLYPFLQTDSTFSGEGVVWIKEDHVMNHESSDDYIYLSMTLWVCSKTVI